MAAIDAIAKDGVAATTVRELAELVGVSPPLIIHHFGSKAGLVTACDDHVRAVIEETIATMMTNGWDASVQALLAVPDVGRAVDYVSRSLADGGDIGRWWFDQLLDMAVDVNGRMVAAGSVRRLDDEEMGIMLVSAIDIGMLLMRPLVEARLGQSLTAPETLDRWARAEVDLLTNGYLIEPTSTDEVAEGKERA